MEVIKLTPAEKKYHINKLELLSVITCLEKNKFLLFPRHFKLRVDNRALLYMKKLNPPGRLVERLLYILSNYNFSIEHKRSEQIPHVDYLSREGCSGEPEDYEIKEGENFPDLSVSSIIQPGSLNAINCKEEGKTGSATTSFMGRGTRTNLPKSWDRSVDWRFQIEKRGEEKETSYG